MLKNLYGETRTRRSQQQLDAVLTAHERYATSRGGARAQLAHAELDGMSLAGRNLQEADFSGASLVGADLSGANLERASFYCADLRDCDLQAAKLTRADLRGASFRGAKLGHAVLDNADLRAAMMMYVGAEGVSVVDGDRGPKGKPSGVAPKSAPAGVDFSNCSLKGASFGNAKLDGANFSGALLTGVNFKNARLTNVTFQNAVLSGVNLKDLGVPAEALAGAVTDVSEEALAKFDRLKSKLDAHQAWIASGGASGGPANLDNEDLRPLRTLFVGRHLSGLSAKGAVCIGVDFSGCLLHAAKLDGADLRDAEFGNADLRGASLKGAKLAHARFDGANLGRLPLNNGTQLAPDLTGADATEEQFYRATLEDKVSALGLSAAH
ncbi:MAG TPA: pentapeptide repeat-containing protein [Rhizomicrobium sp.]|nr:pentapeptide repeat-containing protein [Rhizomicrobium sp.]